MAGEAVWPGPAASNSERMRLNSLADTELFSSKLWTKSRQTVSRYVTESVMISSCFVYLLASCL